MFRDAAVLILLILVQLVAVNPARAQDAPLISPWTIEQAIAGIADNPQKAEEAFRQDSSIKAKLYLALLQHLRGRQDLVIQGEIRRNLSDAQRALALKNPSRRERLLEHFQTLPTYDGTTDSLAQQLRYFGISGKSIAIPCRLMRRHPDLYSITAGVGDRQTDRSLPGTDCERSNFPELAAAFAFWDLIDPITWEPRQPCGGTITRDYANGLRIAESDLLFGPAIPSRRRYSEPALTVGALGLEHWSRISLWNWEYRKRLEAALDEGAAAVAAYYQAAFDMSPETAEREARIAMLHRVFSMASEEPSTSRTLASAILEGGSAESIRAGLESGEFTLFPDPGLADDTIWQGKQEPALMLAVTRPDVVQILLHSGVDPGATNGFGKNALMTAAQYDNAESIALLLKSGADIDARTLHPAEISGNTASYRDDVPDDHYDHLQYSCGPVNIRHGERTALMYAAAGGSLPAIRTLVDAGADIGARDSLGRRAVHYLIGGHGLEGNRKINPADLDFASDLLMPPTTEEEAFHTGGFDPREMTADALLRIADPDIVRDERGRTALYWAASLGYAGVVGELSQNPARLRQVDLYGEGPLHAAIDAERTDIVQLLLRLGADPSLRIGHGRSPLRAAIDRGSAEIIKLLLAAHANVNESLSGDRTLLTYAVRRNHSEMVAALINAGAPAQGPERQGMTTLGWAVSSGNADVVKRILQEGFSEEDLLSTFEHAVMHSRTPVEVVGQFLAAGADPNHRSEHYGPVLQMATIWANADIVRLLGVRSEDRRS